MFEVTLTVRDCPESAERLAALRRRFEKEQLDALGRTESHWVMELQKRGVPHLHLAVVFEREPNGLQLWTLRQAWCRIAKRYRAEHHAQHVAPIRSARDWSRYVAKHSGRSVRHYQREGLPASWKKSGRLWGHTRGWATRIGRWLVNAEGTVQLRRLMRNWAVRDAAVRARCEAAREGRPVDWAGVEAAARVDDAGSPARHLRGVRLWVPEADMEAMLHEVAGLPGCVVGRIVPDYGDPGPWVHMLDRERDRARALMGLPGRRWRSGAWRVEVLESGPLE